MREMIRNIVLLSVFVWLAFSFFLFQKECWSQRNRVFTGTVMYINNSMGKHSSTCILDVDWDGIGEQEINGGNIGCVQYKQGDRISVPRGWNLFTGKNGTAYIPEDPKLLSDSSWIIYTGSELMLFILVCFILYLVGIGFIWVLGGKSDKSDKWAGF